MNEKMRRISVTVPSKLLEELEQTAKMIGYKKRSKAVSDALRRFIADHKLLSQIKNANCAGTVTFTYKHHLRGLTEALTSIQHEYSDTITSSLHVHLDEETCLETLAVKGKAETVRNLIRKLETLKTENVQYILLPRP